VGLTPSADYERDVRDAERFLQGDQQEDVNDLQSQMIAHAEALEFEKAAELLDRIGFERAAPAGDGREQLLGGGP
jgi:excinuclease ABC subunit C